MKRFILLFLLMAVSCEGFGCAQRSDRVVCLGDSVTYGYDTTIGYVDYLKAWNYKLDIINKGTAGETAERGADKFFDEVIGEDPHTVVIMYGLNDMLYPRNDMAFALTKMVFQGHTMGYRVLLCTPSPHMEHNARLSQYAEAIRSVARFTGAILIDVHRYFPYSWDYMATGNHPNEKGHAFIAEMINRRLVH